MADSVNVLMNRRSCLSVEFIGELSDYQFFKEDPVPWNWMLKRPEVVYYSGLLWQSK